MKIKDTKCKNKADVTVYLHGMPEVRCAWCGKVLVQSKKYRWYHNKSKSLIDKQKEFNPELNGYYKK
jgi:uncharacterized C2H2 Zn-finger protein